MTGPVFRTRFTEMFGVEHPIVQGGMQWVGRAELVAAVSNAGGLGIVTALTQPTPEDLAEGDRAHARADRQAVRREPDDPAVDQPAAVRRVPPRRSSTAASRSSRPPAPTPSRTCDMFTANGVKVHPQVHQRPARAEGRSSVGVDAVSIDGFECAGHPGEDDVPGLVLIPAAADAADHPDDRLAAASATRAAWSPRWRSAPTASTWAPASCAPRSRRSTRTSRRQIVADERARHRADLPHPAQHRAGRRERGQPRGGRDPGRRRPVRGRPRAGGRRPAAGGCTTRATPRPAIWSVGHGARA